MDFIEECYAKIDELDLDWDIYGVIDQNDNIYSLTDDSKILGRIFELMVAPAIRGVAEDHDLEVSPADSQTIYPDFTLMESEDDNNKIAVDVKSTYRNFYKQKYTNKDTGVTYEEGDPRPYVFTLGGFASFLRNPTKNIQFHYDDYDKHYIIGFVYSRNTDLEEGNIKDFADRDDISPPCQDIEYFIQEKYKVAGTSPGSGNTENIGSFKTNDIEELKEGNGPFAGRGEEVFEEYWSNYPRYREGDEPFTNLEEYDQWKEDQD